MAGYGGESESETESATEGESASDILPEDPKVVI
jgi:hypothetical protein